LATISPIAAMSAGLSASTAIFSRTLCSRSHHPPIDSIRQELVDPGFRFTGRGNLFDCGGQGRRNRSGPPAVLTIRPRKSSPSASFDYNFPVEDARLSPMPRDRCRRRQWSDALGAALATIAEAAVTGGYKINHPSDRMADPTDS